MVKIHSMKLAMPIKTFRNSFYIENKLYKSSWKNDKLNLLPSNHSVALNVLARVEKKFKIITC